MLVYQRVQSAKKHREQLVVTTREKMVSRKSGDPRSPVDMVFLYPMIYHPGFFGTGWPWPWIMTWSMRCHGSSGPRGMEKARKIPRVLPSDLGPWDFFGNPYAFGYQKEQLFLEISYKKTI